jgi:hypothetical protein
MSISAVAHLVAGCRSSNRLILVVWLTGLTTVSLLPLPMRRALGTTGIWHDAGHLLCFAITGFLFLQSRQSSGPFLLTIWPIVAFPFTLECLEWAIYANRFEWKDVLADILGLMVTVALSQLRVSRTTR